MSRPPLPILATVSDTYRFLFANFLAFIHAAAGWLALLIATQLGLASLAHNEGQRAMAMIMALILSLFAGTVVAITWHRLILLQEAPRGPLPFRGSVVLTYLMRVAVFFVIAAVGGSIISAALWFLPPSVLILLIMLAVYVATFLLLGRLLLILPAAAVGEKRMTMRAAWAFTVRNTWRLFAGLSLSAVPLIFVSVLVSAGIGGRNPALAAAVGLALSLINAALLAGFASFAYRHFTQTAQASAFS